MSRTRRCFTAEQKAPVVRRPLSGKEAVLDLADEFGLQPSQIPLWVKQVLDQAEKAWERSAGPRSEQTQREKIAR
ncbi:MAG: transposase [Planctomycetes bacterium]|nr:transposase [Planctomycetota bacterium]